MWDKLVSKSLHKILILIGIVWINILFSTLLSLNITIRPCMCRGTACWILFILTWSFSQQVHFSLMYAKSPSPRQHKAMCEYRGPHQSTVTLNTSLWVNSDFKSVLHWGIHELSWQSQWSAAEPRLQPLAQPNERRHKHTERLNHRRGSATSQTATMEPASTRTAPLSVVSKVMLLTKFGAEKKLLMRSFFEILLKL